MHASFPQHLRCRPLCRRAREPKHTSHLLRRQLRRPRSPLHPSWSPTCARHIDFMLMRVAARALSKASCISRSRRRPVRAGRSVQRGATTGIQQMMAAIISLPGSTGRPMLSITLLKIGASTAAPIGHWRTNGPKCCVAASMCGSASPHIMRDTRCDLIILRSVTVRDQRKMYYFS